MKIVMTEQRRILIRWVIRALVVAIIIYGIAIAITSSPYIQFFTNYYIGPIPVPWSNTPASVGNPQLIQGLLLIIFGLLIQYKFGNFGVTLYDQLLAWFVQDINFLRTTDKKRFVAFLLSPTLKTKMAKKHKVIDESQSIPLLYLFSLVYRKKVYKENVIGVGKSTFEKFLLEDLRIEKTSESAHDFVEKIFRKHFTLKGKDADSSFLFFSRHHKKKKPMKMYYFTLFADRIINSFKRYLNEYPRKSFRTEIDTKRILICALEDLALLKNDLARKFKVDHALV